MATIDETRRILQDVDGRKITFYMNNTSSIEAIPTHSSISALTGFDVVCLLEDMCKFDIEYCQYTLSTKEHNDVYQFRAINFVNGLEYMILLHNVSEVDVDLDGAQRIGETEKTKGFTDQVVELLGMLLD